MLAQDSEDLVLNEGRTVLSWERSVGRRFPNLCVGRGNCVCTFLRERTRLADGEHVESDSAQKIVVNGSMRQLRIIRVLTLLKDAAVCVNCSVGVIRVP